MLWQIGERAIQTRKQYFILPRITFFFIEFVAPLFPSLPAKSFLYCLEDGKTQVGGDEAANFLVRLFNANDMTDGFGGSHNHFSLITLATTWCRDTIGNEGSSRRAAFKVRNPGISYRKYSLQSFGTVLHSR